MVPLKTSAQNVQMFKSDIDNSNQEIYQFTKINTATKISALPHELFIVFPARDVTSSILKKP